MTQWYVAKGQVAEAVAIINEAADWLKSLNMPLWKQEDLTKDRLLASLEPDNFCVGWLGGQSVSAMLLQWSDAVYWPEVEENTSGFIHKFCVRRGYAGTHISRKMIEYAVDQCKEKGINYLRLDTVASRGKLCKLYEGFGFKEVKRKNIDNNEFVLYELRIG